MKSQEMDPLILGDGRPRSPFSDSRSPHGSAFGAPGIEPRWTGSAKEAVGTAYATASTVWYTLSLGVITEVYYPTIDRPQVRDLQYMITDGKTFVHEEKRDLESCVEPLDEHALGFRVINSDPAGRYRLVKEVIGDPHQAVLLMHTRLEGEASFVESLQLFALLAPHLEIGGWGNSGSVREVAGRRLLCAEKDERALAMAATIPFRRCSCGFVGASDGWTDLMHHRHMEWEFETALDGNIALMGELDLSRTREFTLGVAFGDSVHRAATTLLQSLTEPFDRQRERFVEQWTRICRRPMSLAPASGDGGALGSRSQSLLLAHEDKQYQGALIASLSIPWGNVRGDDDIGGYHLVWTRDLCQSATGLMAAGNLETPLRAMIYLACSQNPNGGFYQSFFVNGSPYWKGIQLDEVAFPIILSWRLHDLEALQRFDPYPMVLQAARFLIEQGPATDQERWEENNGYSPSTLAACIAALVCAAWFARLHGDEATAAFIEDHADFLEARVEAWTVTKQGVLVPGIPRHYIRILPVDPAGPQADEDPDHGTVTLRNRAPDSRADFPARDVVDAGFLELVRYGIRKPDDRLVEDSLQVVDAILKVDTPLGPCWRRYNHDGYGQRDDGSPFEGWGRGRAWPLLTGERAHYELAAGRDVRVYVRALEAFARSDMLLPEQVWDGPDLPDAHLRCGYPTGAAMPLMWAHAEYLKLLRSLRDGQVFELIPPVVQRYWGARPTSPQEVWKANRQPRQVAPGTRLRIQASTPFILHWTANDWQHAQDSPSTGTALGIDYVDIPIEASQRAPIRFTFRSKDTGHWEGRDYEVLVR